MSAWETIENAIVQAVQQLTLGSSSLLATVKGRTARDRKSLVTAVGRELLPAAYVLAVGRDAGDKATRRPGAPAFNVLLATRSLRDDDEARTGSDDVTGMFDVSEKVAEALQDLLVDTNRRLLLVDERSIGPDEGTIVWEQRYVLRRQSEISAPTFGGVALAGSDSEAHVELGRLRRAVSAFSFPGIDGVFERNVGIRERPIKWSGQLRAANDSVLNNIESNIEDEVRDGEAKTMVDSWGRSHQMCVLKSFLRCGRRQRDELTGESLQDFEIEFTQLGQ
ncbi:MAG: hypothetical protein JSV03_15825 [Planctomycetota bacterium]|nr:MAG: hypothetical protein JSV03_15825 [Planctomycetota bacterium]